MRRSVRDAIVGLSIVGALATFAGASLWLRGIRLGAKSWQVTASFSDATGLAERAPVTYRGILIGNVGKIQVTPSEVLASLEINQSDLKLAKPVTAKVIKGSLLGGDVQIALKSSNLRLPDNLPLPGSKNCQRNILLCDGEVIPGDPLQSISTLTSKIERLFEKIEEEDVLSSLSSSTQQFDLTQKNLDMLIEKMKDEINRAEPIITNLNHATSHISNVVAAINNPKTLDELKETVSSAKSLTEKMDSMGGDLAELMSDEELKTALRSVTIGLGKFFDEVYNID